jgi:hypothetical protein
MKRMLTAVAALALMLSYAGAAGAAKSAPQKVEGSIALPQNGAAAGPCIYRTHRALMATAGQPNGVVGYTFDVDPKTVGKPFKLEVGSGIGMDISFYADLGDPSDPTTAPANMGFETLGAGGEAGKVPADLPIAFVCMTDGANGTFTYTAGKGVK